MTNDDKTKIDLTDPDCEPTADDYRKLFQAVGDRVRVEQARVRAQASEAAVKDRARTSVEPRVD